MNVVSAVMLSIIVEAIITYFKDWVVEKKFNYEYILSAGLGITLAVLYRIDIITLAIGVDSSLPIIGEVLTGILLSRGSNYVWDIWQRLLAVKNPYKEEK